MVGHIVRAEIILGDANDTGRSLGESVLSVGRVAVMRGDGPLAILEGHFKGACRRGLFVEFDDLERRSDIGVGEVGKKRLALIDKGIGSCCFGSGYPGKEY